MSAHHCPAPQNFNGTIFGISKNVSMPPFLLFWYNFHNLSRSPLFILNAQVDAHVDFAVGYETSLLKMWAMAENEYGVLRCE
jgi:hypothetical protein